MMNLCFDFGIRVCISFYTKQLLADDKCSSNIKGVTCKLTSMTIYGEVNDNRKPISIA